jgi:hypothetical protein
MMKMIEAGPMGAIIGLGCGLANYVLVMRLIGRQISAELAEAGAGALTLDPDFARRLRPVRLMMQIAAFGFLPLVGYLIGRLFGSEVS